jgi:alkaline phosphatase D
MKAGGVIFISGDRHSSEISRLTGENINFTVYEVTSTALNNSGSSWFNEVNEHRLGVPISKIILV